MRRWLDFRNGHSTYLIFALTFVNFVVVTYTLALERVPSLKIFDSMTSWGLAFLAVYIPVAVIIGHIHLKKQVPREQQQLMEINPYAFITSPGKEKLYNLPATVIAYTMQLKSMTINNQMADAFKKAYNIEIVKWNEQEFANIRWLLDAAVRLQKGDNINDIVKQK